MSIKTHSKIDQEKVEKLGKLAIKGALGMAQRSCEGGKKTITAEKFFAILYDILKPFLKSFAAERIARIGRAGSPESDEDLVSVGFIAIMKRLPGAYRVDESKSPFDIGRSIVDYALQQAKGEIKDHLMTRRSLIATTKPAIKQRKISSNNLFEVFLDEKKSKAESDASPHELDDVYLQRRMSQTLNNSISTSLAFSPEEEIMRGEIFMRRRIHISRLLSALSPDEKKFALNLIVEACLSKGSVLSARSISQKLGFSLSRGANVYKEIVAVASSFGGEDQYDINGVEYKDLDAKSISHIEQELMTIDECDRDVVRGFLFPKDIKEEMSISWRQSGNVEQDPVAAKKKRKKATIAKERGRPSGIRQKQKEKKSEKVAHLAR